MIHGIWFYGMFALMLLGLKLAEAGTVAEWSWWAVLATFWGPVVAIIVLGVLGHAVAAVRKARRGR